MGFWDMLKRYVRASNPVLTGYLTKYDVESVLKDINIKKYEVTDNRFKCIKLQDLRGILPFNIAKIRTYRQETYDCDDYAKVLMGQLCFTHPNLPFGVVHVIRHTDIHALNFFITSKKKFFFIEPQSNDVFSFSAGRRRGYKPYFAYI